MLAFTNVPVPADPPLDDRTGALALTNDPLVPAAELDERTGALALTNDPLVPDAELDDRTGALALTNVPLPAEPPLDDKIGALALTNVPLPSVDGAGLSTGVLTVAIVPVGDGLSTVPTGASTATRVAPVAPVELSFSTGTDPVAGADWPTDVSAPPVADDWAGTDPMQRVAENAGVIDPAPARVSPATAARMATTAAQMAREVEVYMGVSPLDRCLLSGRSDGDRAVWLDRST
jgi:hypothetical protein